MNNYYYGPNGNQPNYWAHQYRDYRDIQSTCSKYMNYHVIGQMSDGSKMDGILESMDDEGVTMLVAEDLDDDSDEMRQYGGYRRRFRRYRRRHFPFRAFIFPFFIPFPYFQFY
jgi:hypothetical protein